jgi:2-methylisocitrate lyase-like PEP mutase family enzyme
MAPTGLNEKAKKLRQLCKPGDPLVLTNVYDGASANAVVKHPSTKAVATASYAVAAVIGVADADLTQADNLVGIRTVSSVVNKTDLPLTADLQDGYDDIRTTIRQAIEAGVVGANIEDVDNKAGKLRTLEDSVSRIKAALEAAAEAGVPDFCLNARTDTLVFGGSVDEAIERGKAFREAGATTVYIWGGPSGRGLSSDEIKQLVKALDGMINVKMNLRPGFLNVQQIADLGVARISVGPEMWAKAMTGFNKALETIVKRESFL